MWAAATKVTKFFTGPTVDEQADNAISSVDSVAKRQQDEIIDLKVREINSFGRGVLF